MSTVAPPKPPTAHQHEPAHGVAVLEVLHRRQNVHDVVGSSGLGICGRDDGGTGDAAVETRQVVCEAEGDGAGTSHAAAVAAGDEDGGGFFRGLRLVPDGSFVARG